MAFYNQNFGNNKEYHNNTSFNSKGERFTQGNQSGKQHNQPSQPQGTQSGSKPATKEDIVYYICNKRNHTAIKCINRFNHSVTPDNIPQSFVAFKMEETPPSLWHLDIGATYHMTGNQGKLYSLNSYLGLDGVMVGDGKILPITQVGQAVIRNSRNPITLKNVLVSLELKNDLVSISKLTTDYPLSFKFNGNGFVITNRTTQQIVAKGLNQKGLYIF